MLDRFLVIAEGNSLAARIIINKVDLVGEKAARERFAAYERAGYPVHYVSVKAAIGVEAVRSAFAGRRSVLSGPSGVGKSSLLNALFPGANLRVGAISESVNKGMHTTVGALDAAAPRRRRRLCDRHTRAARSWPVGRSRAKRWIGVFPRSDRCAINAGSPIAATRLNRAARCATQYEPAG